MPNYFLHSTKSCSTLRGAASALFVFVMSTVAFASSVPGIKHTMLVTGTGLNYVGIIDTTGTIVWKHDEIESGTGNGQKNDCWLLPNGNVVYSYQWGVRIVDIKTNKVIWDRPTPIRSGKTGETHSCQPLEEGSRFLIPECFADTAFIVEVDTAKKELCRIALKNQGSGTHSKWRQIRKTAQNTYLVSSYGLHHSYEYDTTGRLLHDFPAGGYVATRLTNGNTLIATGDDCRFVEYNASGSLIWEINNTTATVKNVVIGFGSEAQRLPNGNTIITNWGGHGTGVGAAVVEVKPDRTVVGSLPTTFPTNIASVKIIDGWKLDGSVISAPLNKVERSRVAEPIVSMLSSGVLTCTIPYTAKTLVRVFNCDGRMVFEQTVDGSGSYRFTKEFARGVYTVTLRNALEQKRWSRGVVVSE